MKILANYRNMIYAQSNDVTDFMSILMKQRNNKGKWTQDDMERIRHQIKLLSDPVPFLVIFILPLGFLLLPLLAKALDRRKKVRAT